MDEGEGLMEDGEVTMVDGLDGEVIADIDIFV